MSALAEEPRPPAYPILEGDAAGVSECVAELREALRAGNVERVQELRWLAPRPPGERDLLSDMAVAEGIPTAIEKLSRFWQQADVHFERVRPIDATEAELYERLQLPVESLPIVTLVRRRLGTDPWSVVCTNEAHDERFVLWIPMGASHLDEVALASELPADMQLLMDGHQGVLAHDRWMVHVRGPMVPEEWPETLPGETPLVLELATALAPAAVDRREQLRWLLAGARAIVAQLGGSALWLQGERRVWMPGAIDAVLGERATARQAASFWVRPIAEDGWIYTEGLRLLGLPEIEAEQTLLDDPTNVWELVSWLTRYMVGSEDPVAVGTEVSLGEESLVIVGGRRGPKRGRSYGRCGAVRIADRSSYTLRGSRSRLRAPAELAEKSS